MTGPPTVAAPDAPRAGVRLARWLNAFRPAPTPIGQKERWRAVAGAALGILATALVGRWAAASTHGLWLVAPMGASAVLIFCVPASPLAQPWAVVAGNTSSALIGVACARWIGDPVLAGPLAVSLAIAGMLALRCLHPPGGAMALSAVLGHSVGLEFAWLGALFNSVLLVVAGIAYNHATGRRYPHPQVRAREAVAPPGVDTDRDAGTHITAADLDAALALHNEILDISRGDLETLLRQAEMAAFRRNLGALKCADVMHAAPVAVEYGTLLQDAWALLRQHRIKALPVVDRARRIVGIVTQADFLRHAGVDRPQDLGQRLRDFVRRSGAVATEKPEVVGQIMSRQVRVASAARPLTELVPLFSEHGHHHIPVIDEETRLVGIITQSDLVRTLYRAVRVRA
jgi:CBS domain-containing membrane protein